MVISCVMSRCNKLCYHLYMFYLYWCPPLFCRLAKLVPKVLFWTRPRISTNLCQLLEMWSPLWLMATWVQADKRRCTFIKTCCNIIKLFFLGLDWMNISRSEKNCGHFADNIFNEFSLVMIFIFWLKFHNLFLVIQYVNIGLGDGWALNRRQ